MKPILISGAGIGGITLARALRRASLPVEVYERDAHAWARGQGYRIRISTDGLDALKQVLSQSEYDEFMKGTATTGGGGLHGIDAVSGEESKPSGGGGPGPSGKRPGGGPGLGGDVLGVARGHLREQLMKGYEDKVHFNHKIVGYELNDAEDSVTALFADGTKSPPGSLLVGADGVNSAITKQLTNDKVRTYDTGARMIHGQTPASAFKGLGEGVWFVNDSETVPEGSFLSLITNVRPGSFDDPKQELGWVFAGSPGSFDAPDGNFSVTGKVAADLSRKLTEKWHPKVRAIFEEQNDAEAAFLKMHSAHPDGIPEWKNEKRVTILGDAVHAMTPAGGVGANCALKDAALLGKMLGDAGGPKEGVTEAFEKEMREYGGQAVKYSYDQAAERFKFKPLPNL